MMLHTFEAFLSLGTCLSAPSCAQCTAHWLCRYASDGEYHAEALADWPACSKWKGEAGLTRLDKLAGHADVQVDIPPLIFTTHWCQHQG